MTTHPRSNGHGRKKRKQKDFTMKATYHQVPEKRAEEGALMTPPRPEEGPHLLSPPHLECVGNVVPGSEGPGRL